MCIRRSPRSAGNLSGGWWIASTCRPTPVLRRGLGWSSSCGCKPALTFPISTLECLLSRVQHQLSDVSSIDTKRSLWNHRFHIAWVTKLLLHLCRGVGSQARFPLVPRLQHWNIGGIGGSAALTPVLRQMRARRVVRWWFRTPSISHRLALQLRRICAVRCPTSLISSPSLCLHRCSVLSWLAWLR